MKRKILRILALSDFHGRIEPLEKVKDLIASKKFDLVVISGDLTTRGPLKIAQKILESLLEQLPVLAVPGNMDPPELANVLRQLNVNLHGEGVIIDRVGFIGAGGEINLGGLLNEAINRIRQPVQMLVFVTHCPPYGTDTDLAWGGLHIGCSEVKEAVEKYQPTAILCGHVHESRGIGFLGKTLVCNPGPVYKGFYAEVNISERAEAELSQFKY